ncbi:FAD-dependent oxidoreductase [Actinocatenispora thailandica]|uniref:FAD-dependent oxidoreductase n=1 Tax=Actinocatenispora thailandica TaxID=227318 RepID=A0A7R7DUD8_9ACTN|nr:NAD(P)/FAD-dependent oxidoreductase [Actinocatenispora thailandica]BCJ38024.1 FAD-dependent oxidoreductase [Actinocatenispora thailandica]
MPDVVVVGAGCAGAPTAMLLARAGYRVTLVDRARFPRDTLSTHYLQQPAVALLRDWGLLDAVHGTGCPHIARLRYRAGGVSIDGPLWTFDGIGYALGPRRYLLDQLLVEAAVAAGVDFRPGRRVTDLIVEDDRVAGVLLRAGTGAPERLRAPLVVGADGMRSVVAARAGAAVRVTDPPRTCVYYSYWPGVSDRFEIHEAPGRWIGVVPTNDGLTLVAAYFPQSEYPGVRRDAGAAYLAAVRDTAPDVQARMMAVQRAERLYGTGAQLNFFRQPVGAGWALVGDAGHHKDSLTARGITDAFHQARLLADSIGTGLDLGSPDRLRPALRRFADRRDELLRDEYQHTLTLARLELPPRRLASLRAVSEDPVRAGGFFRSLCGHPFQDRMRPP